MTKSLKITVDMVDVLRVLKYAQEHAAIEASVHFAPEDQQFLQDGTILERVITAMEDSTGMVVVRITRRKKPETETKQKQKEETNETDTIDDGDGASDGSGGES